MDAIRSLLLSDGQLWVHVAALIAIAIGLLDLWHFRQLQHDLDVAFILAGLGAMGVNVAFNAGKSAAAQAR